MHTTNMAPATPAVQRRSALRIGVGIATMGRPLEIMQVLEALSHQTLPPELIIVSATCKEDVGPAIDQFSASFIFGSPGSCVQRNRAIDRMVDECDVIVFFDDDYIPSRTALEGVSRLFSENPRIAGATGHLLADGINSPGISYEDAVGMVAEYDARDHAPYQSEDFWIGLYGCNMAFRANVIRDVRFDEKLALYGWQEDIDFAARVLQRGSIVKSDAFVGVHRGVKKGRSSGVRLGYSQISNPLYLVQKGTMPRSYALKILSKNVSANLFRSFNPEPWIDRRGRVRGNLIALLDLIRGRLRPERIMDVI